MKKLFPNQKKNINIFCIRYNRPIQQFYDPNYHRQQMNQSQNSIAMMDQSITSIDYNQTPIVPSGWNSIGPTSLQDHSYYMNNDNNYYQPRCILSIVLKSIKKTIKKK